MAKFIKNGNLINIVDLQEHEILAILKINIECTLNFGSSGIFIKLFERLEQNQINYIEIATDTDPVNQIIGYDVLLNMINQNLSEGVLTISVDVRKFQLKEPLLLMIGEIKQELVNSCMVLDYNLQNHVYSIINKKLKDGLSDKLYYFENNNSILAFTKDGPILLYGQTQSIEELICN